MLTDQSTSKALPLTASCPSQLLEFEYGRGQCGKVGSYQGPAGAYPQCVQRVIWTRRTLFFDSLDTQKFMSEFAEDDFS